MLTLSYLCRASNLPKEFEKTYDSTLVGIQARLANRDQRVPGEKTVKDLPSVEITEENTANETEPEAEGGSVLSIGRYSTRYQTIF